MTLTSTLGSPGIEIREIDNSVRINSNTSTTVFVPGFASQGPVDEVMSIGTIADFETIYGVPTNAAERYFYYTVKALVDGSGAGTNILCSRLPYGQDAGDTVSNAYTMLAYPAIPVTKTDNNIDFDQFVLDTENTTKLENALSVTPTTPPTVATVSEEGEVTEGENGDVTEDEGGEGNGTTDGDETPEGGEGEGGDPAPTHNCTIKEFVLSLDDDHLADNETLTISSIASTSIIPKIGANYYDENGAVNTSITAPTITFDGGITAKGHIAYEKPSNEKTVHFSYSLMNKKNGTQVGSLYIKVVYDATVSDAAGMTIIGGSNCGISVSFKEAFKIADKYNTNDEEITYIIGSPVTYQVSLQQYYKIITGETLKWSNDYYDFTDADGVEESKKFTHFDALGHAAFIVINTSRSIINSNFEGFYLGITDNTFGSPSEDMPYNAIESIKTTTETYDENEDAKIGLYDSIKGTKNFQSISTNRLSFPLNTKTSGSISHVLTRNITSMDITGSDYDDTINMALFKLSKSADNSDVLKLNYSVREKYNWSFDKSRLKSVSGSSRPVSAFVENVVENSNNLTVLMNPYISGKTFVDLDGNMKGKIRVFGSKLLNNLEHYEKKYLCNNTANSVEPTTSATRKNVSAMAIATMARSSINSWASLVKQAGITPKFIKKNFMNYTTDETSASTTYKMFHPLNSLMPFGTYTKQGATNKLIGNLPAKLERALELVENDEQYPDIDIILEGGLGTIYTYSKSSLIGSEGTGGFTLLSETGDPITDEMNTKGLFDENSLVQGVEDLRTSRTSLSDEANDFVDDYRAVQNVFVQFANSMQNGGRGDTFYISDVPRGVLLKGKNTKICNLYGSTLENNAYDFGQNVNHSFSTSIYYPIKHLFDTIVSSYMSTYAQWVKILDNFSSEKVWIPISGYIAANMAATDGTYGPWYAAAGLRRGVINGTLDYALSPTISQRTDLYKICINSVPKIPNYGVTIWGIRTMGKKDSAFDQNTCRRTFLYMEKKIKQLMRYYIFEPNTSYTRLQIYNDIYPFLEKIKNAGGIYNYTLVCDTTNNTPDIINNGDLAVSIAAAPTRTAENIIVEFIANKYTEEVSSAESIQ